MNASRDRKITTNLRTRKGGLYVLFLSIGFISLQKEYFNILTNGDNRTGILIYSHENLMIRFLFYSEIILLTDLEIANSNVTTPSPISNYRRTVKQSSRGLVYRCLLFVLLSP